MANTPYYTKAEADSKNAALKTSISQGIKPYETKALLPTTGATNTSYKVTNDPTSSNNGYYHWNGSVYVKDANLANGVIESGNVDAVSGDKVYNYVNKADLDPMFNVVKTDDRVGVSDIILSGIIPDEKYFLNKIYNRSGSSTALVAITNSLGVEVCWVYRGAFKTGVEDVILIERNTSGITGTCRVDWDSFATVSEIITLDWELNLTLSKYKPLSVIDTANTKNPINSEALKTLPLDSSFRTPKINPKFGVSNMVLKNTNVSKKYYLDVLQNLTNVASIQIKDSLGLVVCWFYDNTIVANKTGIEDIVLVEQNASGISGTCTVDWDAFAGTVFNDTVYPNLEIDLNNSHLIDDLNKNISDGHSFYDPTKNIYPKNYNAIDLCADFRSKVLLNADDINIVFFGDSLFAKTDDPTQYTAQELTTSPVWFVSKQAIANLYGMYVVNKTKSFRFDNALFSENTGSWADGYDIFEEPNVAYWTRGGRKEGNRSRYSQTASASFSYTWDLAAFEKSNFVYDLDYRAAKINTITISGGAGNIEIYNGSSWVEANGYVLNQWIDPAIATEGSGNALNVCKVRLKMRRVLTTGVQTITVTKDGTTDYLFYWGAEFWNGNTVHFHNAARGGHSTAQLSKSIKDLVNYTPDFIVFETPLINEVFSATTIQQIADKQQDFIWGDRIGFENANSLKNLYPSTDKSIIIPHVSSSWYSGDDLVIYPGFDKNSIALINLLKTLFIGRTDYGYIDLLNEMINVSRLNGWTLSEGFTGSQSNPDIPISHFFDGGHLNDYGASVWSAILNANLKIY